MENDQAWPAVQHRLAVMLMLNDDKTEATQLLEETSRWFKTNGDYASAAKSDHQLAHALNNGDAPEDAAANEATARELYRTVWAVYSGLGMTEAAWVAQLNIAESFRRTGHLTESAEICRTVLAECRDSEDQHWFHTTSVELAWVLATLATRDDGDDDDDDSDGEADEYFDEALQLLEAIPIGAWGDNITENIYQLEAFRYVLAGLGRGDEADEYETFINNLESAINPESAPAPKSEP
jgi:hypothetical protein